MCWHLEEAQPPIRTWKPEPDKSSWPRNIPFGVTKVNNRPITVFAIIWTFTGTIACDWTLQSEYEVAESRWVGSCDYPQDVHYGWMDPGDMDVGAGDLGIPPFGHETRWYSWYANHFPRFVACKVLYNDTVINTEARTNDRRRLRSSTCIISDSEERHLIRASVGWLLEIWYFAYLNKFKLVLNL